MRGGRASAALVSAFVLVVYVLTLHPEVAGGDSGELVGAVVGGGVIHPPGYPAYSLLGRLFSALMPWGNVAWRLNLMSAVFDACAAGVLFLALAEHTRSRAAALAGASLFAFAPGIWGYAVLAEVFALNNLLVAILFYVASRYVRVRDRKLALWGAFAFGVGLSNHHTILFSAIPLAAWVLWVGRKDLLTPRGLAGLVLALCAGLVPYLYLPLAASRHAVVTWGAANTWDGFWTHVLRREYGTFQLAPTGIAGPGPSAPETISAWADDALGEVSVGAILAVAGLVSSLREARHGRVPLGLIAAAPIALSVGVMAALGNLPVGDALHRGIVARFWQQPTVWLCVLCGLGIAPLAARIGDRYTLPIAAAIALFACGSRYDAMDFSKSTLVKQYGAEYLRAAPPGALMLTKGDLITNTVRYLQLVEHARPDVRVVDQELIGMAWMRAEVERRYPGVVLPGARYAPGAPDGYTMKQLLDANAGKSRIVICGGVKAGDITADATYGRWPSGYCDEIHSGSEPINLDAWIQESEAALPHIDFQGQPHPPGSWEDIVWGDTWEVRNSRAAHLLTVAGHEESRRKYIPVAATMLEDLVKANPKVPAHVYRNLATALGRSGLDTPERRSEAADAWERWLAGAPNGDPQRAAIEAEVRRLRAPMNGPLENASP